MENTASPRAQNINNVPVSVEELKKAYREELQRYRESPEMFIAYHKSMEQVDRWLEEDSRK